MQAIRRGGVWFGALVAALVSVSGFQARAQTFPDKPVHIIVGVVPGGGTDTTARLLAQQLTQIWGQPVIVENRPGAASAIADEYVAKSTPDGYTLLVTSDDLTVIPAIRAHLPYDVARDLTPVALVGVEPNVLVAKNDLPVHSAKELIALAKSEPGKLTYGSAGIGSISHLDMANFAYTANINIIHVPYKGTRASAVAVASGEVDTAITSVTSAQSLADAGKLKVLAVSGLQRSPLMPSVPTISESGLPGFNFVTWVGVFGPAGLPKDVLATLNAGINKAAHSKELQPGLLKQAVQLQTGTPAQFKTFVLDDLKEKVNLAKGAGVQAQ